VDREQVGSALVDTPSHLAALTEDIRRRSIQVPLRLGFNPDFGVLDGNHRIAVALRLGFDDVPVALIREPIRPRPTHGQSMHPSDLQVLEAAFTDRDSGAR
jgi:ParB-like chromosome segregation protein Spo0J